MGWNPGKAVKKAVKSVSKSVRKVGKAAKKAGPALLGGPAGLMSLFQKGHTDEGNQEDLRSKAAGTLVKKAVKRQAGQGQIDYTGEFYE